MYQQALQVAIEAAREAGALLRRELHRPTGPRADGDHSPADKEAEVLIRKRLLDAFAWAYLGEDTGEGGNRGDRHVWVVDPNDGTRAFLRGRRGTAVSIAALRDGRPVLGVVYAFAYPDDDGDMIAWAEGMDGILRNGELVNKPFEDGRLDRSDVVLLAWAADSRPSPNADCVAPARYRCTPSIAYRLALAAIGSGCCAVSVNSPKSWDYAAGHAIVRGAGGVLLNERGQEVSYDKYGRGGAKYCFGGARTACLELVQRRWADVLRAAKVQRHAPYNLVATVPGRLVSNTAMLRRAQGCLFGQIAGDALGSQVEFVSRKDIAARFPDKVRDLCDGGTFDTFAGQPTDDTEMALMLARTLAHERQYSQERVLDAYVHWYQSEPFDIGATIAKALRAARGAPAGQRVAAAQKEANPHSQANGSLMRVSPIGIFAASNPQQAAELARLDSSLTHPHPNCVEACAAFVAAIATAIHQLATPQQCLEAARQVVDANAAPQVLEALNKAPEAAPDDFEMQQGWVLLALQNAFYQLLHAPSLEEGIIDTVFRGGDTDTNAAIAGALLGAVHGRDAVPRRWGRAFLACRPLAEVGAHRPRPVEMWPVDAHELAELLLTAQRG